MYMPFPSLYVSASLLTFALADCDLRMSVVFDNNILRPFFLLPTAIMLMVLFLVSIWAFAVMGLIYGPWLR
ncbi:hypothetical protein BDW66DRAFT_128101 [Aspergillus desertorum]